MLESNQIGQDSNSGQQLLESLESLRGQARRRLLIYGGLIVAAGGLAALLFVIWMDWLFSFPGVLRLLVLGLFVGGFLAASWRWLFRPAIVKWRAEQLAAIVQRHFGDFEHRLTSALDFVVKGPNGSEQLAEEVVRRAEEMLQSRPPQQVLNSDPLKRAVLLLSLACAAVVSLVVLRGDWLSTGIIRYVQPFGDLDWPRDVEIVASVEELIVPFGESVEVRMEVVRGTKPNLRGIVHFRDQSGVVHSRAMTDSGDGVFVCMIDSVNSDLTYWFEAGDDHTHDHPGRIRAVARPEIRQISAVLFPPEYAEGIEERTYDLLKGPAEAVIGSRAVLMVSADQAVGCDVDGQPLAWLRWDDEENAPMPLERVSETRLAAEIQVDHSLRFHVEVTNSEGLTNRIGEWLEIVAGTDKPPVLRVEAPSRVIDATPEAAVELHAVVEDDFGISDVGLAWLKSDQDSAVDLMIRDSMTVSRKTGRSIGSLQYEWSMSSLNVEAGDVVDYVVWARDNRPIASSDNLERGRIVVPSRDRGQLALSTLMRIRILSAVEYEDRLRGEFSMFEGKVRELLLEEEAILEETIDARNELHEAGGWDAGTRGRVDSSATRQAHQIRKAEILAERFSDIADRMTLNKVGNDAARALIQSLTHLLKNEIGRKMAESARSLQESLTTLDDPKEFLDVAAKNQELASELLRQALQNMGQWGEFQEVLTRVRDLLDRQQLVRSETARISPQTLGQQLEDLPEQAQTALREIARRQQQLAEDLSRLTDQMQRIIDRIREKDPAAADALAAAGRAAASQDVKKSMERAAEAVGKNRTSAAALEHRRIEEALKDILDTLHDRRTRELAELVKRVEAAIDAVNRLLRQQQELLAANVESQAFQPANDAFETQANHQRQLARNTGALAEELGSVEKTADAGRQLQEAVAPMDQAHRLLLKSDGMNAQLEQESAIESLSKTVAMLERISADANQSVKRQSLSRVIDLLVEIIRRQESVHERSSELVDEVAGGRRVNRKMARQIVRLAGEQEELRVETEDIRTELEEAKTYGWILDNCLQRMDEAKAELDRRSMSRDLVDAQLAAIDDLQLLVDAIRATMGLESSDQFADSGGSGGGEGQAGGNKGLPGVTELLVLRAMQVKLNQDTKAVEEGYHRENPTEQQLRQIRSLGRRQRDIQIMLHDLLKPAPPAGQR